MRKALLVAGMLVSSIMAVSQTIYIQETVKFLALGDSYTIGQSVTTNERWPVQLIEALRDQGISCNAAQIIAQTGWRTDDLMSAINDANLSNTYNLVSLLIGVNNQYQGESVTDYRPGFTALLEKAIALAGGNKNRVFVLSIPDYGYTPFGQSSQASISAAINQFNNANASITQNLGVAYINITDISRQGLAQPDLVASDGLHPSGKMYEKWVERIVAAVSTAEPPPVDTTTVTAAEKNFGSTTVSFPNPFDSMLTIKIPSTVSGTIFIKLIDEKGTVPFSGEVPVTDHAVSINMSKIPSGMYVYQLQGKNGFLQRGKVVKK